MTIEAIQKLERIQKYLGYMQDHADGMGLHSHYCRAWTRIYQLMNAEFRGQSIGMDL